MNQQKTIFIFAYYSFKDPIFQSAVLPYFVNFPEKEKFKFVLLTWEQKQFRLSDEEVTSLKANLTSQNIIWYKVNWHSGRFKLIKKLFDFSFGILFSLRLIIKHKVDLIYSEGFPGAIISHYLSVISGKKHIVHSFEPHADYMVEGGVWHDKSWEAILLRSFEKKIARRCHLVMTATEAYKDIISSWGVSENRIILVPSCVDTSLFSFSIEERIKIRKEQAISDEQIVITYLGKFGGMYMEEELFEFFKACEIYDSTLFRYFVFTSESTIKTDEWLKKYNLDAGKFLIKKLAREDVPKYLSASDLGFVAVRQFPSKRFCSPIKDGEYWSCGLPIIIPARISDDYLLVEQYKLGFVLDSLEIDAYQKAINEIVNYFKNTDHNAQKEKLKSFVENNRDIKKYQSLFQQWFNTLNNSN